MNEYAIKVEHLSKLYNIGSSKSGSLRESLTSIFKHNNNLTSEFLALNNVSFNIEKGRAVGIIGKNGAGKSTLLKILSRITVPSKGTIDINGRVSSLLEVGTGFHPELTGRENIYLNGTILGMTRKEVKSKFEEIVDFSGIEKFLDTPVKHYSSGMYVRLAFSVAAHLEPEILIIDEVLAVGDSVFQVKCLDKMTEVARSGKTILFVSHNMQAVKNLCDSAILIENGEVKALGNVTEVISTYMLESNTYNNKSNIIDLLSYSRNGKYKEGIIFKKLQFDKTSYKCGERVKIKIELTSDKEVYKDLLFGININDNTGNNIIHLSNIFINQINITHLEGREYIFEIEQLNLRPGFYSIDLFLRANEDIQDWIFGVGNILVEESNMYNFSNSKMITGILQPQFSLLYK